jgi:hypothetical protein
MSEPLPSNPPKSICNYYVDEAGDGTLFSAKGKVIIGQEGCSRYFMLGILEVSDSATLSNGLTQLRNRLLNDPYFRKVPSMQPKQQKTAIAFHAKDDVAEVRREVFAELMKYDGLRFYAVVRDKFGVLTEVRNYKNKRYHPNLLYDQLITRLFKDRLHKNDEYMITFATRGSSDRTQALKTALEAARRRFERKWDIHSDATMKIHAVPAATDACLQAADYFLWAIQRCYERREDRYMDYVWSRCRLIWDVDDRRKNKYGVYYNQKTPLHIENLPSLEIEP